MRFLMLMIPGVYQGAQGLNLNNDFAPTAEAVAAMTKYNEDLAKAGVLISLNGLQPPSKSVRVTFPGGKATVKDGPFTEAKEVIGGYWLIQVDSKQEAVEWARRVPAEESDVIELRQIYEMSDFPDDVRAAADSPAVREQLEKGGHA